MQACVDVAFPYAHLREAFGKKIGEHQVSTSYYSYLFAPLALCLSVCLPAYLSVCLSVCLPACLSVCLSACQSVACLSVCLSVSGIWPFSPQFDWPLACYLFKQVYMFIWRPFDGFKEATTRMAKSSKNGEIDQKDTR